MTRRRKRWIAMLTSALAMVSVGVTVWLLPSALPYFTLSHELSLLRSEDCDTVMSVAETLGTRAWPGSLPAAMTAYERHRTHDPAGACGAVHAILRVSLSHPCRDR